MKTIDLRSDTVTLPAPEMRTAYLLTSSPYGERRLCSVADKIQDRAQAKPFLRAWVYDAQASSLV